MSTEVMEVCDNCQKEVPESKIATHFGYCRRNIKKCEKCGEMYDINFLEDHEEEFHKMANCKYCKKQISPAHLSSHEQNCSDRTVFCEYCELNVPKKDYGPHLKACQSRTKNCEKCRRPIPNKEYLVHTIECPGFVTEEVPVLKKPQPRAAEQPYEYKPSRGSKPSSSYNEHIEKQREAKIQEGAFKCNPPVAVRESKPSSNYQYVKHREVKPSDNTYSHGSSKPGSIKQIPKASNTNARQEYGMQGHQISQGISHNINHGSGKEYKQGSSKGISSQVPSNSVKNDYRRDQVRHEEKKPQGVGTQQIHPSSNRHETNSRSTAQNSHGVRHTGATGPTATRNSDVPSIRSGSGSNNVIRTSGLTHKGPSTGVNSSKAPNIEPSTYQYKKSHIKQQLMQKDQHPTRKQTGPYSKKEKQYAPSQKFDERDYLPVDHNLEHYDSYIPQDSYLDQNIGVPSSGFGQPPVDEDPELQKAIMMSMGMGADKQSSKVRKNPQGSINRQKMDEIPPELLETDMMNESFYDKQRAIYEELTNNKRR